MAIVRRVVSNNFCSELLCQSAVECLEVVVQPEGRQLRP